ncbi:MAG: uroporphyrinogen decarboxylase family protein [Acidobacteria bacterium]|nr:uroporphyrinogen decarboxylase family protein [Acidobacteriota bacterium]MBU4330796.1 uroporphyrinogen decarboxylase family protein [Acidobacteriota bacterium]
MRKAAMTSRERWEAVLRHQKPDRTPMDYWATPEFSNKLMAHLECETEEEALRKLNVDFVVKAEPLYCGPSLPAGTDVFGCRFRDIDYGSGEYRECITHPLAEFETVDEIKSGYTWPVSDWWDYSVLPNQLRGHEDHPVIGGSYEPFLIYKQLRGEEQSYLDLVLNPDLVHYCLDKLLHLDLEEITRIYETIPGQVLLTYVAEDMGGQEDLLFSPEHIRAFLLPHIRRVINLVHSSGVYVFHHNDGAIRRILPDMVEAGIDLLNPIQWRCQGLDRRELKKTFGDQIVFHGAMDNQETLPFGTVTDVEREVRENLDILGKDGGYILAPCHNIQPLTPVENVVAMYRTCFIESLL